MKLNGSEIDTLYKLFNGGPQHDGDLPSKNGMIGLIEKGLASKDYNIGTPSNYITIKGMRVVTQREFSDETRR